MAICENLGFYDYSFTHNTFNRKPPTIDLRPNPLNYNTASPVSLLVWHASQPPRCGIDFPQGPRE
jgi:hypothetical protein